MVEEYKRVNDKGYMNIYSLEGNIDNVIKFLEEFKDDLDPSASDIIIDIVQGHGYYDDIYIDVNVSFMRDETDAEQKRRLIAKEKARIKAEKAKVKSDAKKKEEKIRKAEDEKKLYEKLHKKYGGK